MLPRGTLFGATRDALTPARADGLVGVAGVALAQRTRRQPRHRVGPPVERQHSGGVSMPTVVPPSRRRRARARKPRAKRRRVALDPLVPAGTTLSAPWATAMRGAFREGRQLPQGQERAVSARDTAGTRPPPAATRRSLLSFESRSALGLNPPAPTTSSRAHACNGGPAPRLGMIGFTGNRALPSPRSAREGRRTRADHGSPAIPAPATRISSVLILTGGVVKSRRRGIWCAAP